MLQCFTVLVIVAASLNFVQPGQGNNINNLYLCTSKMQSKLISFTFLISFNLLITCLLLKSHLSVLVQPKSQVTFQGTTVSFFCEGTGSNAIVQIDEVLTLGGGLLTRKPSLEEEYRSRNVSWMKISVSEIHIRWAVHVYASLINNNTEVQCFFDEKISSKAIVVIVQGKWKVLL